MDKCFIRGVHCIKESCAGCPHEQETLRYAAIVRGAGIKLPPPPDDERRHQEAVQAQLAIAQAQRDIAVQLYWARRYRSAGH